MIRTVLAPNPGPLTLNGTNTYLVVRGRRALVVDPGPDDLTHLEAVVGAAGAASVAHVVATHGHPDHVAAVPSLVALSGAAVLDPGTPVDRLLLGTYGVEVTATPGHTPDSVCLLVTDAGGRLLLTGDTVLGEGPSVVDDLADYLRSLDLIAALVAERGVVRLLPGHGPAVLSPREHVAALKRHRTGRLEQVRAAYAAGARTPEQVVAVVYPDLEEALLPAARASATAQLAYLAASDERASDPEPQSGRRSR